MMNDRVLFFVLWIGCCYTTSCDPNIEKLILPPSWQYTILECYLTPGYPPELTLTNSNAPDEELLIRNLWYADVSIRTNEKTYPLKNILYAKPDRHILVNYRGDDTLRSGMSDRFELSVTTRDGVTLRATAQTVAPIRITGHRLADSRIDIAYDVENDKADFLKISIVSFNGEKSDINFRYFDVRAAGEQTISVPWKRPPAVDSVMITLFHIRKEYYDYGISLQNAISAYHDPFLTPEGIRSNIEGGTGIFTCYTFDRVIVF